MGGRGSGGRRTGSGRKKASDLERAISGIAPRGVVVPFASPTAIAPVTLFDPPAWLAVPPAIAGLLATLERLTPTAEPDVLAQLQWRIDELTALGLEALAVWHELAPHAFAAHTLTPATTMAFVMLCRAVVIEQALASSPTSAGGANHRGMAQRVSTWKKDFSIWPLGKPLYAAEEKTATASPLDRFTHRRSTDAS
jgi:hypothetical protein